MFSACVSVLRRAAALSLAGISLGAAGQRPDRGGFTPARPAPAAVLRQLATDRPDATEGPYTVDAGHWQLEMDFANTTHNRLEGERTRAWEIAPLNVRLGVLDDFEAGIFLAPYIRRTEEPRGGPRESHAGPGDVTVRAKFNFWGNNGGESAFGLIADLKLPAAAGDLGNGQVEVGFLLPVAFELGGGWGLGAMTGLDWRQREGRGRDAVWINSATLGHDLARNVSGYVELTAETGNGPLGTTFNAGVAWKLNANLQLDAGANFGLSRATDDVQVFAGLSRRY